MTIHVICFGNFWAGDDGFGIHIFNELAKQNLPPKVRIFDAGLLGIGALNCFAQCDKAIVVDALLDNYAAGSVHRLTMEDVLMNTVPSNTHDMGVNLMLRYLPIALEDQPLPEVVICAVAIEKLREASNLLSDPVKKAIPLALMMITEEFSIN